jgi:hypothetical protein
MASWLSKKRLVSLTKDFSGPFKWKVLSPHPDDWKSYCGDFMSDRKQKNSSGSIWPAGRLHHVRPHAILRSVMVLPGQNRQDRPAL